MLNLREYLEILEDNADVILVANDDECYASLGNHKKENWLLALEWLENPNFTVVQMSLRYGNCICLRLGQCRFNAFVKRLEAYGNDAARTNAFIK